MPTCSVARGLAYLSRSAMTDIGSQGSPLAGPAHFPNHRDLRTVGDEGWATGERDGGLRVRW